MKHTLALLPFLMLLAGCAAPPVSAPVQTSPTSKTPPAAALQPSRTVTAAPTQTNTPFIFYTRTPTVEPTPTIDVTVTAIVEALLTTVTPRTHSTHLSPDGQWRAEVLIRDCTKIVPEAWYESAYEILHIVHLEDGKTDLVDDQLQYCGGVGGSGLGGIAWSPDSRYFYFTNVRDGVPDGSGGYGWHRPLLRYDTQTMQTESLGSGLISPDGKKLASATYQPNSSVLDAFTIQTLDGEILARFPTETIEVDLWLHSVSWAASSQELVYLETPCRINDCRTTLYRVDLASGERTTLVEDHQPAFLEVDWSDPERLTLADEMYKTWYYTFEDGMLAQKPDQ